MQITGVYLNLSIDHKIVLCFVQCQVGTFPFQVIGQLCPGLSHVLGSSWAGPYILQSTSKDGRQVEFVEKQSPILKFKSLELLANNSCVNIPAIKF